MAQDKNFFDQFDDASSQTIVTKSADPYRASEEARRNEDQGFQREQIRIAREKAARDQREWEATHNPDGSPKPVANKNGSAELTAATRAAAINAFTATRQLDTLINDIESKFRSGPGSTSGVAGAMDWLPTPGNKQFDAAGNAVRGAAITALGFTSGQTNTPKEVEMNIGPYIPQAGDYDAVIQDKIARLKELRDRARVQAATVLGGVPDASGRIMPLNTLSAQERSRLFPAGTMQPLGAGDPKEARSLNPSEVVRELGGANAKAIKLDPAGDAIVTYGDGTTQTVPLTADQKNSDWYGAIYRKERGQEPPLAVDVTDNSGGGGNGSGPSGGPDRSSWQSGVDSVVRGAADTASLGLADEAQAGLEAAMGLGSFGQRLRGQAAIDAADQQQNPYLRMGGQIAGSIFPALGAARGGMAALPSRPALGVAGAETLAGSLYGAGSDNENRLRGAAVGGVATLAGNQLGQRVIAPIARGMFASRPAQAARGLFGRVTGREVAPLPQAPTRAEGMMLNVGEDQTVDQIRNTLNDAQQFGLPMSLADANPQLRTLAGSASRLSTRVREMAEPLLEGRARGQAERAAVAAQRDFGAPVNVINARTGFRQQAQAESDPFYRAAYERAAPVDPEIDAMLQRPAGREALNRAVQIAQNEGRDPLALGFDLNDAGEVVTVRNPSFETLHMVKRGMDSMVEGARGLTGVLNRDDPAVAAIDNLRRDFRGRLGQLDDNYRQGNAAYAAQMRNRDALNFGYDATKPSVTPNTMADAAQRLPIEPMRQGYRAKLFENIDQAPFGSNPYERIVGSPEKVAKSNMLFPEGTPNFMRQAELEREMAKTAREVIGGSPTASRRAADEAFAPALGGQMLGEAALGLATGTPPIAAGTQAIRRFIGDRMAMGFGGARRADEVGNLLLDTNPATGVRALDEALARRQAYRQWQQETGRIGGIFGAPLLTIPAVGYAGG